jgi:rhodanese-related sulfurtransferase
VFSLSSRIKGRPQTAASLSDSLLENARGRLQRITADEAAAELAAGGLLIDIRTSEQRLRDGEIRGARPIDRTILEWRLDPTSPSRIAEATSTDLRVVLICAEGYSSSLAAATLQEMGLPNATDVIGGFEAWKAAGLPIEL